ncbi:MAG: hypothetical protein ACOCN3_08525, partial [Roseburia inulinivorans]
ILNFQGSAHLTGVGSLSILLIDFCFFIVKPTAIRLQTDIARQIHSAASKYLTISKSPSFRNRSNTIFVFSFQ